MPTAKERQYSTEITKRFLIAMDCIVGGKGEDKITAKTFGEIVTMSSSNISRARTNPNSYYVTVEAMGRLCDYFNISESWLISGKGKMENDVLKASYKHIENNIVLIEEAASAIIAAVKMVKDNPKIKK